MSGHLPEELRDKARGPRLQKVLAEAGIASRRDCEALILEGDVRVNGQTVTALPIFVNPQQDRIEVDGHPIAKLRRRASGISKSSARAGGAVDHTYVILRKPKRVITTTDDPQGRTHVLDLLPAELTTARRLFPVGRLDADSTGLILLSDDGQLANRLTHPRYGVPKQYHVSVQGHLSNQDLSLLKKGIVLAHKRASRGKPQVKRAALAQVKRLGYRRDKTRGDRTRLVVTLREGQNREIRRLLARLGYKVRRLERVAIGPIRLKGLASGQWRLLSGHEVKMLYKAAGLPT